MQAALAELTGPGFEYTAPLEALYSNLGWHIWIYENRSAKLRIYHNTYVFSVTTTTILSWDKLY